jgi:hypothetical protein
MIGIEAWNSVPGKASRWLGGLMDYMDRDAACSEDCLNELQLTRNILLAHILAGNVAPKQIVRFAKRYEAVTHWEELLCAVFSPNSSRVMAVVSIRQKEGYSGILRRHGSIEFVRFFIDWLDGSGMQEIGLSHFKVCDAVDNELRPRVPSYHFLSCGFEAGRYSDLVRRGIQPQVRAVLSWNYVPEIDVEFMPVFGNRVDSLISVESDDELTSLFSITGDPHINTPLYLSGGQPYTLETVTQ